MKKLQILVIPALLAVQAIAQTTGTITVTGTNPEASSITNTSDATLSSTVSLGTLTPQTGSTLTTSAVSLRLRSNKAYKLSAQAASLSFSGAGAADGGSPIALSDVGFGITAIDATGGNLATGRSDTVGATFDYRGGYPAVTNGVTPFVLGQHATLNDVISNTQILNGTRISARGNMSTNNNFVLVTLGIATLPQYFTPATSFSSTVTLTIATP